MARGCAIQVINRMQTMRGLVRFSAFMGMVSGVGAAVVWAVSLAVYQPFMQPTWVAAPGDPGLIAAAGYSPVNGAAFDHSTAFDGLVLASCWRAISSVMTRPPAAAVMPPRQTSRRPAIAELTGVRSSRTLEDDCLGRSPRSLSRRLSRSRASSSRSAWSR